MLSRAELIRVVRKDKDNLEWTWRKGGVASILGGVEEVRGVHGCIYEYISRRGWRFWSWRGFEDMRVQRITRG
jgi:hypothetical protein